MKNVTIPHFGKAWIRLFFSSCTDNISTWFRISRLVRPSDFSEAELEPFSCFFITQIMPFRAMHGDLRVIVNLET